MPRKPPSKPKTRKPLKVERIHKALTQKPQTNRELRATLGLGAQKFDPRLDRKLQQLRKEGKIQLVGGHWAVLTIVKCPHCDGRGWVENKGKTSQTGAPAPA
jgi:hypothetical protein